MKEKPAAIIEKYDAIISDIMPTSKSEILKDMVSGLLSFDDSMGHNYVLRQYITKRRIKNSAEYSYLNWYQFCQYYLSKHVQLYIDCGVINHYKTETDWEGLDPVELIDSRNELFFRSSPIYKWHGIILATLIKNDISDK